MRLQSHLRWTVWRLEGKQTRSEQDGTDGASQQDVRGRILKGMFEVVGFKNNFW